MAEENQQEHGKPATMGQVKSLIRRKIRRQAPHEEMSLNIYPMIDMMTILLVFLIMQFANSTSSKVAESEELQIPYTMSRNAVDNALTITISRKEVTAPNKDQVQDSIVTLNSSGLIDPNDKQGGSNGFLVMPLLKRMEQHSERLKKLAALPGGPPFEGDIQIVADKRVPFRTLAEVIYTLGQCKFNKMKFVLKEGTRAKK